MISSHYKGKITELGVAQSFLRLGYQVCEPLVSDSRYDLIVDINGKLFKIQVKTSSLKEDGAFFEFCTSSSHTNTNRTINRSYTSQEIDYFATMFEERCYIIPVEECGSRSQRLRLLPTKNGQKKNIMFAEDYLIEKTFPID
jgi:hypothetical protein